MKVHLYTLANGQLTASKELTGHRGEVTTVAYSPDGTYIASGDSNREVLVWKDGAAVVSGWVFHTARVNAVAWSPDNVHVASVSTDANLIVWNVANPNTRIIVKSTSYLSF